MLTIERPASPTSSLPPLARLPTHSLSQISNALNNLRNIYLSPPPPPQSRIGLPKRSLQFRRLVHDDSVPDSGYASAEEDEDEEIKLVEEVISIPNSSSTVDDEDEPFDIDVLRSDTFERNFTVKWLTGFTARADIWLSSSPASEEHERTRIIDVAAALLSSFVTSEPEQALTRTFSFPLYGSNTPVEVELNDAPLLSGDHTSVGLQSWASSVLLAERMCANPDTFGLGPKSSRTSDHMRILELGAGTGLLSISAAKILQRQGSCQDQTITIVATDFHPDVLANLQCNLEINFPSSPRVIDVRRLDWEHPSFVAPLDRHFDLVYAADVVYHPSHATWIKTCVERLLEKPSESDGVKTGMFWLIVALRASGRHEGVADTVKEVFPNARDVGDGGAAGWELAVLAEEMIERQGGIGRADEGGYKLFKIGWVRL
ncbi:hypothetical protein EW146_g6725 [Bondarzewia mesenterica]|uniref:Methyltransferase domain-containing protein n=1 Tax=Bondarzewia mesenterica TaxID=1095465 RepID=A0A4S4LTE0_9AGAM|nr:hypothetical protein EW146_g6725 [Bondarzewia mesenterica]